MKHKTGKNGSQKYSKYKNTAIKILVKPKPVLCNLVGESWLMAIKHSGFWVGI